jgi:1,4-dihydroxy-2-naphthoate octaprenyltransferase
MIRLFAAVLFFPLFACLLVLAALVSVLRGVEAVIGWVSDLATPLVFRLAEIADGRIEDGD